MKQKLRTKDWLTLVGAVDSSPRIIKAADRIECRCTSCQKIGSVRVGNADSSLKKNKYGYRCRECKKKVLSQAASLRTGEKNHFFGKKHTQDSKNAMAVATKNRLAGMDKETVNQHAAKMREASNKKYGGNAMHNQAVKQKHNDSTHTEKFIHRATEIGLAASAYPDFPKKMQQYSHEFWSGDLGEATKEARRQFFINEFNSPDGEFAPKRLVNLKDALEKYFEKSENRNRLREWAEQNPDKCPPCWTSKAETEIMNWIADDLSLPAKKTRSGGLELDIFIPELMIGIEYNGLYWHSEEYKTNSYHNRKTKHFATKGIKVFHVFEHEWKYRREQVKSFLLSKLNKNITRLGARKLDFRVVERFEAEQLLNECHIQGSTNTATTFYGGYYNNQLITVASFGRHHRNSDKIVLNRFVVRSEFSVAGALSKVSKWGANHFNQDITSWCDLRWSDGGGYIKAGWEKDDVLSPDYFYTDGRNVFSKQSRKKSVVGTPEGMTEHEHALLDGLFRVYDCGKIRFIFKHTKT